MFGLFKNEDEYDIDENREMFRGIEIIGHYQDRGRVKRFLRDYWDRPTIGWVIQERLKSVDISKSRQQLGRPGWSYARRSGQKKDIELAHDLDNDHLFWMMGHELGHLYGYRGTQSGEQRADDFADEHVYRRGRYRYSGENLKALPIGETMYPDSIFSDEPPVALRVAIGSK